ncbi:Bcr/CflA family multidrug efflux MFS transporter [Leeia oryzae]|uniref:Bcr/CflA family multidrug efflux MFS transporter n=1 Tax=Leeia oryzae TaxID=356662 RepID=UPI000477B35F|nr:Bcr/CflA family multidrug efflux MFS transporter [Leeia oryzae]
MNTPALKISHGWLIALLGLLVAFGPFAIDMYLPNLPMMGLALHASPETMQHTVSAFLVGFCVGMLFYGPLSDRFGRKPLLLSGILLYVVSSLLCALVNDAQVLVGLRVMQALGGGAASVMARAIVRDVFQKEDAAHVLSQMALVTMIAPLIAPLLGGWLAGVWGWRSVFILLAMQGLTSAWLVYRYLPETLPDHHKAAGGLPTVLRHYAALLQDKHNLLLITGLSLPFAGMFAFITGSAFVYIQRFGVDSRHFGFLFGANIVGQAVFTLWNTRLLKRYPPLSIACAGSTIASLAGLLAVIADTRSLFALVPCVVVFVGLTIAINANSLATLLGRHQQQIGAISALAVSAQFGFGALASLSVAALQPYSDHAMTLVMLACACGSLAALLAFRHLTTPLMPLRHG